MTQPRRALLSVDDTPYYHCVSRCVRRAFLCGDDAYSGHDYSHRKAWVKERLAVLAEAFAIEICAYAVMSNHYHLVVYLDRARAVGWTEREVIERWRRVFKGPKLVQRYVDGARLTLAEQQSVTTLVTSWRERLASLSWYMRCLNEWLARRANAEDACSGRFWEGRFKCQALLDEAAVVTAMAYVDLNPVRAGLATELRASADTSVEQRLDELAAGPASRDGAIPLRAFIGMTRAEGREGLPFTLAAYLELVDWTGRVVRADKRGAIAEDAPAILETLGVDVGEWLPTVTAMRRRFELVIGSPERMRRRAAAAGRKFYRGYRFAQKLYKSDVTGRG